MEDKQAAATGRVEPLSNPVLRAASNGAPRSGLAVGSAPGSEDGELGKLWRRQQQDASARLHAGAAPAAEGLPSRLELPARGLGTGGGTPLGGSPPHDFVHMQAVCSPTQQLLSRESSECLDALRGGGGSAFERALAEAGSAGMLQRESVLLDGLGSGGRGGLQRR